MSSLIPSSALTIGIDIGGTKVLGGVVDSTGKIIDSARRATPASGGKELIATVKLAAIPEQKIVAADPAAVVKASPAFGLTLAPAKDGSGVLVTDVDPSGVGYEQGMQKGDVILEIGGKSVVKPAEVRSAIDDARKEGRKAIILRIRNEETTRFVALAFPKA